MPNSPLTCLDFWVKAGSSKEKSGEEGMAHFLEHMVFKGSLKNAAGVFDREIEALGGTSNAATGFDDVHYYVLIPPTAIPSALDLLLDLVLEPAIRDNEYAIEREVVLEEIAQHNDQPEEQVFQILLENCWSNHAYGRPILGLRESLISSTPKSMKEFHKRLYRAENCCLSIAGRIPTNIQSILYKSQLGKLDNLTQSALLEKVSNFMFQQGRKEITVKRLESARVLIAWPIAPAKEQNSIMGADIATSILGEGRSSRLVKTLREELQLVESIDAEVTAFEEGGLILIEACCKEKNIDMVEKEIYNLINQIICEGIPNKELERAHYLISNGLCFNLEAASQVASLAGAQTLWDRKQSLLKPLNLINNWNSCKLQEQIFRELTPEKSFTLIASPSTNKQ